MPLKGEIVSSRDIFEMGQVITRRGEKLVITGRKRLADAWAYTVMPERDYVLMLAEKWSDPPPVEEWVPPPTWWSRLKAWWSSLRWL